MGGGRRGRGGGDGPVPVLASPGPHCRRARLPQRRRHGQGAQHRDRAAAGRRPHHLSINFKEGQEVKRGDVLAKIDPATYQAQLDQARGQEGARRSRSSPTPSATSSATAQLGGNVVAQKTIDTQRALVAQLTAQIKQDDAAIANAKAFLDYTTIVSPIDGRTGIRMVDEGNLVRACRRRHRRHHRGAADRGAVHAAAAAARRRSTQAHGRRAGQRRSARRRRQDRRSIAAPCRWSTTRSTQTTGTVRMKAEFPNANLQLWPGQFVNVRVLIDTLEAGGRHPTQPCSAVPTAPSPMSCRPTTRWPCGRSPSTHAERDRRP